MSQESIERLGEWLSDFRVMDSDENTTEQDVQDHLDNLAGVITSMSMDYKLAGIDTSELKVLAMKHRFSERRTTQKRFLIVDELMILSARLKRGIESADSDNSDPEFSAESEGGREGRVDPDQEKRTGLSEWNSGKSWQDVNDALGRPASDKKATESEIKRFAKKCKLHIRAGRPGAKKQLPPNAPD